jgi:diguanylate cyclase (GGDEF)-like protein/PAS domain S-box-containing protein
MNILEKIIIEKVSVVYAVVNRCFIVNLASERIDKFAAVYTSNIIGDDIRNYFPELFGLETIMIDILEQRKISFELEGICRQDEYSQQLIYFNLQILAKSDVDEKQLMILFEDVTDQFKVKQELVQRAYEADLVLNNLSAAKAYIDNLIKSMADALFVTNADLTIEQINPASEQLFGYKQSELIGQSISLIIPDINLLKQLKEKGYLCETNDLLVSPNCTSHIEVNCQTKTGDKIVVAFACSMFLTEITELQHYLYMGRDITDRRRMEAELKQANENLTTSVNQLQERNREITRLSGLTHRLQGCFTVEEAYEAIGEMVPLIFPHSIGAIFTNLQDQQQLEIVAQWGNLSITNLENFSIKNCRAWQTGERYFNCAHLLCSLGKEAHLDLSKGDDFCIPMMAQGQTVGLLYLSWPKLAGIHKEKRELAMTVAEHIGLALVNLKLRETLKNQSIRDPLTGLFNRRYLEETVERKIERASEQQKSIGLIILDVDHFKRFNDTFGHQAGDVVLQAVSKLLMRSIRPVDLACRYGGEEFIVILRDASLKMTQATAEKLRSEVKLLRLEHGGQSLGSIASSFGVACFPQHGQTLPQLVAAADAALYQAKESGRDRVVTAVTAS